MIKYEYDTLQRAIMKYGREKQVLVAVEEMSELQKELLKNCNRNADNMQQILEEMADVYIMLKQLMMIYHYDINDLNTYISRKQERLRNRLDEEV